MLIKKNNKNSLLENDVTLLLQSMDKIIAGELNNVDATNFSNPQLGEKLNAILQTCKAANNPVVIHFT